MGYVYVSADVKLRTFEKKSMVLSSKQKKDNQKKERNLQKRMCCPQDSHPNLGRKWKFISCLSKKVESIWLTVSCLNKHKMLKKNIFLWPNMSIIIIKKQLNQRTQRKKL